MKEYILSIKLRDGEILTTVGNGTIDDQEIIEARIKNKEDIIVFGSIGVRRDLIDWYTIAESVTF